jgi:hypothetical protein
LSSDTRIKNDASGLHRRQRDFHGSGNAHLGNNQSILGVMMKRPNTFTIHTWIVTAVAFVMLCLCVLLMGGCASNQKHTGTLGDIGQGATAIGVRATFIDSQVETIDGHKNQKRTIGEQTKLIRGEATDIEYRADKAEAELQTERNWRVWLDDKWYVKWGQRIERALWFIGISWLLLGVLSIVLGVGNPLGWGTIIGKNIIRLLPLANPFSWVRDYIKSRRESPVAVHAREDG